MSVFFLSRGFSSFCGKALKTLDLTVSAECLPNGLEMTLGGVGAMGLDVTSGPLMRQVDHHLGPTQGLGKGTQRGSLIARND